MMGSQYYHLLPQHEAAPLNTLNSEPKVSDVGQNELDCRRFQAEEQ